MGSDGEGRRSASRSGALWTGFWAGAVLALLGLMHGVQPPAPSLAWRTAFNLGHAPLFGAIGLAVLALLGTLPRMAGRPRSLLYALALGATLLLGATSELAQLAGARQGDLRDFARDALGAGAFLGMAWSFDPRTRERRAGRGRALAVRGVALVMLALAFVPALSVARAYLRRAAIFPQLCAFEAEGSCPFVSVDKADLEVAWIRDGVGRERRAGRITFQRAPYASLILEEPRPDWSGYEDLQLMLHSDLDRLVPLTLRIHDRLHDSRYADRFSRILTVRPGSNHFAIPLSEVQAAPAGRQMDLTSIRGVSLFAKGPREPFEIYLVELRLGRSEPVTEPGEASGSDGP
jgi:hypothetical protein